MFGFKSTREQLFEERRKNAELQAIIAKTNANIEYIAMMTDVDIDETEGEDHDSE